MPRKTGRRQFWREAAHCAVSDGVPRRSLIVALIVGVILNLINQGDALFSGERLDWVKLVLTFAVPYFVATYGAVSYRLRPALAPSIDRGAADDARRSGGRGRQAPPSPRRGRSRRQSKT